MGFDFNICLHISMCKYTGKPFCWDNAGNRVYDFSEKTTIPEEHWRFLSMGGHHLFHYTEDLLPFMDTPSGNSSCCQIDLTELLAKYPSWDVILMKIYREDYDWSEDDHDAFRKTLEWITKHEYGISYYASWSY